jgi:hypothetical protein
VEADLHQVYGVDLDDPALKRRTWRWLKLRIAGLCSTECRLSNALRPPETPSSSQAGGARPTVAYDDPD